MWKNRSNKQQEIKKVFSKKRLKGGGGHNVSGGSFCWMLTSTVFLRGVDTGIERSGIYAQVRCETYERGSKSARGDDSARWPNNVLLASGALWSSDSSHHL